jgi:drug/metabolite transporter (DMT)-like permease
MKPVSTTTTATTPTAPDLRLLAALAAVYVIWSSTYLAMRIGVRDLPPLLMAGTRFTCAGLVMLTIARRRGVPWPSWVDWRRAIAPGALLFLGGNGLVATAETRVSSGGAAVVCATMPLWVGALGALLGTRPSRREWISLVLGFVGVVILMGGPSLDGSPLYLALLVGSPICWALGSLLSRRVPKQGAAHGTWMVPATQMLCGGAALLVVGLARGERVPEHASTESWLALAYLFGFGSLVAFTSYNWLLRNARPAVATSYAYVNPILAVVLGAVVSGETLGATTGISVALIVGALVFGLAKPKR